MNPAEFLGSLQLEFHDLVVYGVRCCHLLTLFICPKERLPDGGDVGSLALQFPLSFHPEAMEWNTALWEIFKGKTIL